MPRGVPKVKPPKAEKSPMLKHTVELPPAIAERVARAAKADERPVGVYLRRFIVQNVDVMDPDGAEA